MPLEQKSSTVQSTANFKVELAVLRSVLLLLIVLKSAMCLKQIIVLLQKARRGRTWDTTA